MAENMSISQKLLERELAKRKAKREYDSFGSTIDRAVQSAAGSVADVARDVWDVDYGAEKAHDNEYVKYLKYGPYKRAQDEQRAADEAAYMKERNIRMLQQVLNGQYQTEEDPEFSEDRDLLHHELAPFMTSGPNTEADPLMMSVMTDDQKNGKNKTKKPKLKGGHAGGGSIPAASNKFLDMSDQGPYEEDVFVNPIMADMLDQSMKRKGLDSNLRTIVEGQARKGSASDTRKKLLNMQASLIAKDKAYKLQKKKLQGELIKDNNKHTVDMFKITSQNTNEMNKLANATFNKNLEFASEENQTIIKGMIDLLDKRAATGDEGSIRDMNDFYEKLKASAKTGENLGALIQLSASSLNEARMRQAPQAPTLAPPQSQGPVSSSSEISRRFIENSPSAIIGRQGPSQTKDRGLR